MSKPAKLPQRLYLRNNIPLGVICGYARQIAERFRPDLIMLFGSYAYGTPHGDSDVDLLVIMPCRNELDMSVKITWELPAPFPACCGYSRAAQPGGGLPRAATIRRGSRA